MRRDTLNYLVDGLALLAMLVMIATGLLIKYVLPPRVRGGEGLSLWGMTRHEWGDVHFWAAVGLAALLVLHVALHWTWVCVLTKRLLPPRRRPSAPPALGARVSYGLTFVVLLAALVAGFVWLGSRDVGRDADQPRQHGPDRVRAESGSGSSTGGDSARGRSHIRGSMTLAELADEADISLALLRADLGIPANTPSSQRLGALGRRYGFEMDRVHEVVARRLRWSEAGADADNDE